MKLLASLTQFRVRIDKIPAFHLQMGLASAVLLTVSFVGCQLTSVTIPDIAGISVAVAVVIVATLPLPIYWHEKGKIGLRDAALTIPWGFLFAAFLPFPVAVAARLGMGTNLQDTNFAHLDQSLGVNVPRLMIWASQHWIGDLANKAYSLLIPMIPVSFLLPALTGKVKYAQQFLSANLIAFAVGLPLFGLLPAVGPWYGYHFAARPDQTACQLSLLLLRQPGPYVFHPEGVVCFPSFHVIWAILCAYGLWGFRPLRVPVAIFSGLIILSTMTTGWHFFVDVLAGGLLAIVAIAVARILPG
jgi:membrane-associated phospholipid phosphatase